MISGGLILAAEHNPKIPWHPPIHMSLVYIYTVAALKTDFP